MSIRSVSNTCWRIIKTRTIGYFIYKLGFESTELGVFRIYWNATGGNLTNKPN